MSGDACDVNRAFLDRMCCLICVNVMLAVDLKHILDYK